MYYIFLISLGTIKIFKFQSYYSNSHSLKEINMITKIYHIITIDTQIINSTLNLNVYLPFLSRYIELDQSDLKWIKVD